MNISEIKNKYETIVDKEIMDYLKEKEELLEFIEENIIDDRKGAVNIIEKAKKRVLAIDEEVARVKKSFCKSINHFPSISVIHFIYDLFVNNNS